LLKDALLRTKQVADIVGLRAMIVHARDDAARTFYEKYGFEPSAINAYHLFLKVSDQSGQRSIATVNREPAYLRCLLNIAERNGWINRNPFKCGDALIHVADERKREHILTREEESRMLAACTGPRAHLRPIMIAALDTGCRLGELL